MIVYLKKPLFELSVTFSRYREKTTISVTYGAAAITYTGANGNYRKALLFMPAEGVAPGAGEGEIDGLYFSPVPVRRNASFGMMISNRALFPGVPFSVIVMPVMARISRESNNPSPVCW